MEPIWTTLFVCVPIIVAGTVLYECRQRVFTLCQQKFLPVPFTAKDAVLTTVTLGYALCGLIVMWLCDPLASGVLYFISVQFGTVVLVIVPSRFRSFYTLLFSSTLWLGSLAGAIIHQRGLGRSLDADFVIVFGILFVFLVILPTAVAWVATLFRKDEHQTGQKRLSRHGVSR